MFKITVYKGFKPCHLFKPNQLYPTGVVFLFCKRLFAINSYFQWKSKKMEAGSGLAHANQCRFVSESDIASGKWVKLSKVTYTDPTGKQREWEAVRRTTKVASDLPDGLLDAGETAERCAVRELLEETGYTGTVKHTSPATSLEPGLGDMTAQLVSVEIDGDLPENQSPKSNCEYIDVICVPMDDFLRKLNEFSDAGMVVDSRVFAYAIGMEQTRKMLQQNKDLS
ncbi:NUDT5-like protein [Mya arenaria]|uniref:NUDT5-like protein n=1 Tax=Mya arenaria TaxID=6604 RepID=A0ABY7DJ21_MYAAR|nr:NUDT5-like protein [Mya arenaria]